MAELHTSVLIKDCSRVLLSIRFSQQVEDVTSKQLMVGYYICKMLKKILLKINYDMEKIKLGKLCYYRSLSSRNTSFKQYIYTLFGFNNRARAKIKRLNSRNRFLVERESSLIYVGRKLSISFA